MRTTTLLALIVMITACRDAPPAEGHLTLFIETDTPLGDGSASLDPLFDTLRIELYRDGETTLCNDCARDFPLQESADAPSITVTAAPGATVIAHACIFRARWGCVSDTSLETWAALPSVPQTDSTDTTLSLLVSSVGVPSGSQAAPLAARLGAPQSLARWPHADPIPCGSAAGADDACITGGAFWMGNPSVDDGLATQIRRLLVMSPFFLDRREVSVARYRAVFGANPSGVGHYSGQQGGNNLHDYCTFTSDVDANEDLPINCVTWNAARAYCMQMGGDLPTEAQLEFAAAGAAGRLFVWGDDLPTCEDAAWGREDPELVTLVGLSANECARANAPFPLSTTRDSVGRDVLHTADGDVRDLAGNVSEWALDGFEPASGDCWSDHGVRTDPRCNVETDFGFGPTQSTRGGAWFLGRRFLAAANRDGKPAAGFSNEVGFRCVY